MRSAIFMGCTVIAHAIQNDEVSVSKAIMTVVFLIIFLSMDLIEFIKRIHE